MELTKIELTALWGIANSDFQDGEFEAGHPGHRVWSWSANPFKSKRQFAGALTNLIKKGLAEASGEGEDACVCLTQAGLELLKSKK